jgi:hypothetical protein
VKILGYQPTRRGLLRSLAIVLGAAPLQRLGRVLGKKPRPKHPDDLPPTPWIGHC